MDYVNSFKHRCEKYIYAVTTYPHVMQQEYEIACKMMDLNSHNNHNNKSIHILNIPSGGIHLKDYINEINSNVIYHCFETSPDFAKYYKNCTLCSYNDIPLPDHSIDRIIVLASLHHLGIKERIEFYKECKRLLKTNGKLVIGDVKKNSKQDRWLNVFVNQWNSSGHCGLFFDENDRKELEESGFHTDISEQSYHWVFHNQKEMIDFVIHLFGLDLFEKDHLVDSIKEHLDYFEENDGTCGFKWELIYFICV